MRILQAVLFVLLGVMLGVAGHVAWQVLITPSASASGVLRHEPKTDPAVSASYSAGFFIESRVYLETASLDLVGKQVTAWGTLDLATDPDAHAYPKIRNRELTTVK